MNDAVIVSAVRTPVGKAPHGTLRATRPDEMAAVAIAEAIARAPGVDPAEIDDVILGCAMPEAEQGLNVARIASLRAGVPVSASAVTVNRFCSSGLQAIAYAAERVMAGFATTIVAGGVESMSLIPMGGHHVSPNPTLVNSYPDVYLTTGLVGENHARDAAASRDEQDAFALESHRKAIAAIDAGRFTEEIVPLAVRTTDANGTASTRTFEVDEGPRRDTSRDALFVAFATAGVEPERFGIGPVPAINKVLKLAGLTLDQIELIELNEAFASQVIACLRELPIDPARLNVNGGAIALGHPLGCTGAKLTATLLHEMRRRNARYGMVSMCVGGGMGAAGIFERL
jgi:acetyl-CoA acyltransferase